MGGQSTLKPTLKLCDLMEGNSDYNAAIAIAIANSDIAIILKSCFYT